MGQFSKVLLDIDKALTVPHRALDCRPGLGGLNQVYGPNHATPSVRLPVARSISTSIRCSTSIFRHTNSFDREGFYQDTFML